MAGSITSIFSNRAVVKCSRLEDVLHGCSWKVNNKLDGTYLPLPVDKIIQRTKNMIDRIVQYSLIDGNCEHFVNDLRYGVPRSQQVGAAGPTASAAPSGPLVSDHSGHQWFHVCCTGGPFHFNRTLRLFSCLSPRGGVDKAHSKATSAVQLGHQLAGLLGQVILPLSLSLPLRNRDKPRQMLLCSSRKLHVLLE